MIHRIIVALGESDCESLGQGMLAQPVNALSSLAFSAIGIFILVSASSKPGRERLHRVTFGILMIATGLGSFLYHGPQGGPSLFLHDITFLLAICAIAVMNGAASSGWSERRTFGTLGIVSVIVGGTLLAWPASTNAIAGVVVLGLVGADVALFRSTQKRSRRWVVSLVTMVAAVAFFLLGRTGGPLCDSESLLQGHALWHVLSALALWIYFAATSNARENMAI